MTVVDEKGLRLAREVRAAIRAREEDEDLAAAIEVYDRAVTPAERQAAAAFLLEYSSKADKRYSRSVNTAFIRMISPGLLPPEER